MFNVLDWWARIDMDSLKEAHLYLMLCAWFNGENLKPIQFWRGRLNFIRFVRCLFFLRLDDISIHSFHFHAIERGQIQPFEDYSLENHTLGCSNFEPLAMKLICFFSARFISFLILVCMTHCAWTQQTLFVLKHFMVECRAIIKSIIIFNLLLFNAHFQ